MANYRWVNLNNSSKGEVEIKAITADDVKKFYRNGYVMEIPEEDGQGNTVWEVLDEDEVIKLLMAANLF